MLLVLMPRVDSVFWLHNQTMGRPSNGSERRAQIVDAFARVLAEHGYAGATIAAVATEAGMAPGLVHHHFRNKGRDPRGPARRDRRGVPATRTALRAERRPAAAYVDGALKLDERADLTAVRCWVGLFARPFATRSSFKVRRLIDTEIGAIRDRSGGKLTDQDAGAVLAFIIGALVVGAFAPRKTAGFAAPGLRRLVGALLRAS